MRSLIIAFFVLMVSGVMRGQYEIGQTIVFNTYTKHSLTNTFQTTVNVNALIDTINFRPIFLAPYIRFNIVDIDSQYVSLVAQPYNRSRKVKKIDDLSYYYNNKLYKVLKEEFMVKVNDASYYDLPDRFSIGILTLPFKFRPQKEMSFDSDFNLNTTLAIRLFTLGGGHMYTQIGAGIGGVELSKNNAAIVDGEAIKANALTGLLGVMLQYKKVQTGLYVGTDFINNQSHYQWQYQGKPWLALGIGYQLFGVGLGSGKNSNNQ